ncbi:MAG: helicase-exonuclease AddAB subunit AddB [Sedimentibacter sp.]
MGLNIVAGRAKTGKTTYIYDDIHKEIKKNNNTNLILIVPEQMTYQTEYELIERINDHGIMSAEVLSFTRLAYKVFEEVGGLKVQEINSYGKIMLLKQIFDEKKDELQLFNKAYKQEGFLREFDALISELKQDCISVEFLEQILKFKVKEDDNQLLNKKLEDIIKVYKEINNRTKDTFYDEEDKMDLFISLIEKSDYIKNSIIWIDGFESFNTQRHRIIKELIKYSKNVTVSLNIDSEALKNPHCTEDWEAFKIVNDTYKALINELETEVNIVPANIKKLSNETEVIEQNMFSINSDTYKKETSNIQIFSSLNPYSETEKVAAKIISLVRDHDYRWKDIQVATGDMDSYGINIKKVFTQYEIPYFLDAKRDIMGNPLTKFILSLLDMFIYNFKHDSVFEFLKAGFSSLDYDEVSKLENFALQYGIERDKWFKEFKFNADNLEYFNKLREKFTSGLKSSKKKFKELKTTLDITLFVFEFLETYKVQEKIEKQVGIFKRTNNYELSSENAQVWNYAMDIFEQIVLTGAACEITPLEYRKMIEAGLNEVKISIIPPTLDKVTVGEIEKISFKSSKVLFIIGANEGKLDSKNNEKGLLLDEERELLSRSGINLLNDSNYYIYKEKHILYKLFTNAIDKLFLSYAMGTVDGRTLQPSMYAEKLKQLFPDVKEQSDLNGTDEDENISNNKGTVDFLVSKMRDFVEGNEIADMWKDVYAWYESNESHISDLIKQGLLYENKALKITGSNLDKIHSRPVTMSVSRLESFAACPFKFFMENVIKPRPRVVQKVEFYDLGNIYHQAVEQFTKHITEPETNIFEIDKDAVLSMSQSCSEKILQDGEMDYAAFDANERNKYMKEKIKRLVNRAANTIVEQLKKGNFRPMYTELVIGESDQQAFIEPVEIKLSNQVSIYFQGRIDRVDVLKKDDKVYVNIIDYKSSHKEIDLSDAVQGLQLQLLVYMSAIIKNGERLFLSKPEIGGAYYFCIDDPMIDGDEIAKEDSENAIFKQLSLKGYIVEDSDIIINMDKDLLSNKKSDIIPVSFNKDGSTSKSSKTLTFQEFKAVLNKTDEVAKDLAEKILDGNIDIMPFRKDAGKTPCSYCDYTGVCQFDPSIDGSSYRKIKKLKKDEILLEILNKGGEDA